MNEENFFMTALGWRALDDARQGRVRSEMAAAAAATLFEQLRRAIERRNDWLAEQARHQPMELVLDRDIVDVDIEWTPENI